MIRETYLFGPAVVHIQQPAGVWKLTPHGQALGVGLAKTRHAIVGRSVIEFGVGTGVHAVAALKLGARHVDGTDISSDALQSAEENAALNGVRFRRTVRQDWLNFTPNESYDTVICNPPFCKAGTPDRRFFIKELIRHAPSFLREGGQLLFVQSSMADFARTERELCEAGFYFTTAYETRVLFRDYYFTEPGFIESSRMVAGGFEEIDGSFIETLRVYWCTMKAAAPCPCDVDH